MANHFDRIIKENIDALFSFFAKREGIEIKKSEDLKDKLQVTLEREADFLSRIIHDDPIKDFILHFEFQTDDDRTMIRRLLLYRGILYHKTGLPVKQFVIYLGDKPSKMPNFVEQENLSFRFTIINLCTIDYNELLKSDKPETIIMALLADFKKEATDKVIEKVTAKLAEAVEDRLSRSKYVVQLQVLSNLRNLQSEVIKNINDMGYLKDIDLSKDPLFKDVIEKSKEQFLQEGIEQGREEEREENIFRLLKSKILTPYDIASAMDVSIEYVLQLQEKLDSKPKNGKKA